MYFCRSAAAARSGKVSKGDVMKQLGWTVLLCCIFGFTVINAAEKTAAPEARIHFHLTAGSVSPRQGYTAYTLPGGAAKQVIQVERKAQMVTTKIENARAYRNPFGNVILNIQFNDADQKKFSQLTRKYTGRQLAIIIDGKLYCAPIIMEPINSKNIEINGFSSLAEAEAIAGKLYPGKLRTFFHWLTH